MESFIGDMKAILIMAMIFIWKGVSQWIVGSIFLFFNLEDLQTLKAFAEIAVWFFGAVLCLIYLAFRASDMIQRYKRSRIERQISEIKKRRLDESY